MSFKSCLRNCLLFVTKHSPTHFFSPQSAVKRVQHSLQQQCSSFKESILKALHKPHWQTPPATPARGMSNAHLAPRNAEVKSGNAICPLSHGKPGCSMKFLPF